MAAIHIMTVWDDVSGQLVVAETTQKGLGALKAPQQQIFHDMLLQAVPRNTEVFVTHPDKSLFRLRQGMPAARL